MPKATSYFCNCRNHDYIPTEVSHSTHHRHKPLREELAAITTRLRRYLDEHLKENDNEPSDHQRCKTRSCSPEPGNQSNEEPLQRSPSVQRTPDPRAATTEEVPDEDDLFPGGSRPSQELDEPPRCHASVLPQQEELLNTIYENVSLDDLRVSMAFIAALNNASLDDPHSGLDPDVLEYVVINMTCQIILQIKNSLLHFYDGSVLDKENLNPTSETAAKEDDNVMSNCDSAVAVPLSREFTQRPPT
ncbi:hypothetical protein BS17DRAFT_775888 [Gyrodon lividus]|nr:hypothetical protein BS17DRAFT_775888 [Gyrodon lividus]